MTRSTNTVSRLLAAGLIAAIAGSAEAQHGIPKGGKEISVNAGSRQLQIQVRNDTNEWVEDITIAIYNGYSQYGPNIEVIDVQGMNGDKVDDNGNGSLEGGENDTRKDQGKSNVVKSIFDGNSLRPGATATVNIELDANTRDNTRMMIKFSNYANGKHWDLLASADYSDGLYECFIPVEPGAPQTGVLVNNGTSDRVYDIVLPRNPDNDFYNIELPDQYQNSFIIPEPDVVIIQLDPPLEPNQQLFVYPEYEQPIYIPEDAFVQPIFIFTGPPPCRADLNEDGVVNTLDYLEFLNLYNMRDPEADWNNDGVINTLDFLAFQNDWASCR